ncbi:MAG TPA: right-handed parallel beta-helix repeat-containing protein [Labilithrix sp.]|nr:right-handed parallel beta-helix repeat-containing protein [Labilithrix sp.]
MRTNRLALLVLPALVATLTAACSTADDAGTGTTVGETIEQNAKIVDTIGPNATIEGQFDPRVRAYGYVVPLKAGAKISVTLEAAGGPDARRDDNTRPLDTQLVVNAPYRSKESRGARIVEKDDGAAPASPIAFTADRDQNYLVTFMSNEDTGTGTYKLSLKCEGTDFQCQRANFDKPCTPGQLFVQGAKIEGETTWDKCEVVILESATVPAGSTLTIKPGVTVKGNYIDAQSPNSGFGTVSLNVEGLLQVVGTKEAPVAFTSFKPDRGWSGIVIKSKGNSMRNVVIEKANIGVDIPNGGNVVVTDSLIEGVTMQGTQSAAGIRAQQDVEATFTRALVKGFQRGLHLANAQKMLVEDSVIRNNGVGVQIDGANPQWSCGSAPQPPRWHDPVISHSDIVENSAQGVLVNGSDVLVQISKSNLVNNKQEALLIQGAALAPESFFRENNVYDNRNAEGREVRTLHRQGAIDISRNYWKEISDPELSANWARDCNGQITFTGFAPTLIRDAGPREQDSLAPGVKEGCFKHTVE